MKSGGVAGRGVEKALSAESAEIKPTVFQGGELLHKMSRPQSKKTERENARKHMCAQQFSSTQQDNKCLFNISAS